MPGMHEFSIIKFPHPIHSCIRGNKKFSGEFNKYYVLFFPQILG